MINPNELVRRPFRERGHAQELLLQAMEGYGLDQEKFEKDLILCGFGSLTL